MARLYPTLDQFFAACKNADEPNDKVRSTEVMFKYLKQLFANPRISGHATTRNSALSSFSWNLTVSDATFQKKAEEMKTRLSPAINAILQKQLNTVLYGAFLVKLQTISAKDSNILSVEKFFEPDEFDYSNTHFLIKNKTDRTVTAISRTEFQAEYIFDAYTTLPRGGVLRTVMIPEILRWDMVLENANYLKKLKGILQIINKGTSDDNQAAAETAAANAVKNNYLVTDDMIEFKLNQIAAAGGGTQFKDFNDERKAEISIAMLGQANTSELPNNGGSRAAIEILKLVSADIFYTDMNRVEALMKQLLLIDYKLNYKSDAAIDDLPVKFEFNIAEEQDIEKNAAAIDVLHKFLPMREDEVYKKAGFTPPQQGDKLFTPINASELP